MLVEERVERLEFLAYHDPLTGLFNRNWANRYLSGCDHRHIYFVDLNNLHEINMRGHTIGDAHINKCVLDIQSKIKADDMFIRYGGDEFVLLSYTPNLIHTNNLYTVGWIMRRYLEHMSRAIERADMDMMRIKTGRKTVYSVGGQKYTVYKHDEDSK